MFVCQYSCVGFAIRHVRMLAFAMRYIYYTDYKSLYSCLSNCKSERTIEFVSVSWDKKVNFCSYADGKQKLESLDFNGLMKVLGKVDFIPCNS